MAGVRTDKQGNRRVIFTNKVCERKAIYRGKMQKTQAETVCTKIEVLNAAKIAGVAPADEVTRWTADIGDELHAKIAKCGLVDLRGNVNETTLAEFIEAFIAGRVDVKPGTVMSYRMCRAKLLADFKAIKRLGDVTPLDADRFRSWLKAGAKGDTAKVSLSENDTRTIIKNAKLISSERP